MAALAGFGCSKRGALAPEAARLKPLALSKFSYFDLLQFSFDTTR